MNKVLVVMFAMAVMAFIFGFKQAEAQTSAPVAGGEVSGWSARKQILGRDVYNDKNEKVGKVYDIIIAPDKAVSYGVIAAGGFLSVDKHDVAIPINQFEIQDGKIVLPGATRATIKAMPRPCWVDPDRR